MVGAPFPGLGFVLVLSLTLRIAGIEVKPHGLKFTMFQWSYGGCSLMGPRVEAMSAMSIPQKALDTKISQHVNLLSSKCNWKNKKKGAYYCLLHK